MGVRSATRQVYYVRRSEVVEIAVSASGRMKVAVSGRLFVLSGSL